MQTIAYVSDQSHIEIIVGLIRGESVTAVDMSERILETVSYSEQWTWRCQVALSEYLANMRRWPNIGLLSGLRRRRWPNSKPTLG